MSSKLHGTVGSLIPWWALAIAALMILGLVVSLSGCASFDYDWVKTQPAAPKPWITVLVADADFTCRTLQPASSLERIFGCAHWTPKGCTIYLQADAPQWVKEHEERHCEGWHHG